MRDYDKVLNAPVPSQAANYNVSSRPRKKISTREKIEKLVQEGAKNYPAYLKLVHTGDSDFSDDETVTRVTKSGKVWDSPRSQPNKHKITCPQHSQWSDTDSINANPPCNHDEPAELVLRLDLENGNKKLKSKRKWRNPKDDNFYDTTEITSPEYDNAVNQSSEPLDPEVHAKQQEEWREELAKLEDEITTLRQVLGSKVRQSHELKRKLGITPMTEFKHDLKQGFQNIKESDAYKATSEKLGQWNEKVTSSHAYQKTNDKLHQVGDKISSSDAYQKTNQTLKTVGQKTAAAVSGVGAFASKKLSDVRNSNAFKSFEEKIGGAYSNVKTRVRGSKSESNFEEVLNSTAEAERQDGQPTSSSTPATPADEKVPL